MNNFVARTLAGLVLALGIGTPWALAQGPTPAPDKPGASAVPLTTGFAALQGRWVRPDGGYVITIRGIDAARQLDAGYANPSPLPFSKAEAVRGGGVLKLFFELRAGGYNGSTYTLVYDPSNDTFKGVYYQAVAKQKFDVVFARAR